MVAAARDQPEIASVRYTRVEAREDRRRAPAQESSALPSNQSSLFKDGSSEKSGVMTKQQPQLKQMTDHKEGQHGEPEDTKEQEGEDREQLCMNEGQRGKGQEQLVEYEQRPQTTPKTSALPLSPSHPAEETEQKMRWWNMRHRHRRSHLRHRRRRPAQKRRC